MKLVFIVIHMRKVLYHVTIKNNLLNYNEKNTQQNKMMGRKNHCENKKINKKQTRIIVLCDKNTYKH